MVATESLRRESRRSQERPRYKKPLAQSLGLYKFQPVFGTVNPGKVRGVNHEDRNADPLEGLVITGRPRWERSYLGLNTQRLCRFQRHRREIAVSEDGDRRSRSHDIKIQHRPNPTEFRIVQGCHVVGTSVQSQLLCSEERELDGEGERLSCQGLRQRQYDSVP